MSAIVKAARDPILVRLALGVMVGLISFQGTRLFIELAGGHLP